MKTYGVVTSAVVLALAFAVACGNDESGSNGTGGSAGSSTGTPDAGAGGASDGGSATDGGSLGSGAKAGSDAGTGGGGQAGTGGAAGDGGTGGSEPSGPPAFKSEPAGMTLEVDSASKALGLTFASSRLTQKSTASLHYVEWYAELYNGSDETQCLIAIDADFQNGSGSSIVKLSTYASGPAYELGVSKLTSPCVAPGESVPVWANDLPDTALAIEAATKLLVTLDPIAAPDAVVHPSTPTFTPVKQTYDALFEAWQLSTTATSTANIYNASVTFWGKSGDFFVDNQKNFHLEDFPKGATWAIDTAPLGLETATLTKLVTYFDFIDGLKGSAARRVFDQRTSDLIVRRDNAVSKLKAANVRRDRIRQPKR